MASKDSHCKNLKCKNDGRLNCSRCKSVNYCSQQCQKIDWNVHKLTCAEKNVTENETASENLRSCGNGDCGNSGSKRCSQCKSVWYCSADCQKRDWIEHKKNCKLMMVEQPQSHPRESVISCGKQGCPNRGLKKCTLCRIICYCSKDCQRKDWSVHKTTCRAEPQKTRSSGGGGSSGNNSSLGNFDEYMRSNTKFQQMFHQMSGKMLGKPKSVAQEYLQAFPNETAHANRIREEETVYRNQMLCTKLSRVSLSDEDFTAPENFMKRWGCCLLDREHLFEFMQTPGRKFGDIYERSIYSPYNKTFFQTMRNTSIADQIYEFGQTYIAFGFVDLFQLLWGSFLNDSEASFPLKYYGFDMSGVVTLRSKLIYGALKNFKEQEISTNSILQIWFSSCWDGDTKKAFECLLEDAFANMKKYDLEKADLILMKKWRKNEVNVRKAETEFAAGAENATFDDVWHMKSEHDRISFCRYIFTGIIFAKKDQLVCGNPTMFTEFDGSTKLMGELFFKSIDLNLSSFLREKCLPDSLYNLIEQMTLKKAIEFRDRLCKGKIICHFETVFLDPENMVFAERIKNLDPYGIDWSNIPDYMKKSSFIKFARACSTEKTLHQLHFINWCQYVYGSCHVDWALHQEKCKQMYHQWKQGMSFTKQLLRSTSLRAKYIESEEYVNPLNDINICLSVAFKSKFEDYFLSDEFGRKLNRNKEYSGDGVANNFFAQSPTMFRAAFSFNDRLLLQTL